MLADLWIPIVASALFLVGSVIHMVLGYHGADGKRLADETACALRFVFDGALHGLATAGCFGWLWPGA